ncbi:hypothetical protein SARC_05174 [Sphaeroforma arctica JP610]|uniref:Uncharacterized protein n=1 Tax=Sphaeroforma arctica JP610 TaxID=667725 RepID=A0A0L0G0A7_9EUKA|nr:hypothetical protein SARC_05174 [Sphaeroforma arctica JP610]KNC82547.1 hypothetical protein SARC_05174 [Sphaeroforma arctica JP610]|eukprot:XP_014156449.1 hypothetical protein SARC_05174 [Sphaeroforma arctica JP610]
MTDPTPSRGHRWSYNEIAEAYQIFNRTLSTILQTEISQFIDKPWEAFAALQRKFKALAEDAIQILEGKLNCITQERNEYHGSLIGHNDNHTVKITLKTPAMMAMSYDELTTYLIALDPDESDPSTIDKSGSRHDMKDYRYMSKNNDKHIRSDSSRGYRTREERYNRNKRYQQRYDTHDDYDRQYYRADRYNRRHYDDVTMIMTDSTTEQIDTIDATTTMVDIYETPNVHKTMTKHIDPRAIDTKLMKTDRTKQCQHNDQHLLTDRLHSPQLTLQSTTKR